MSITTEVAKKNSTRILKADIKTPNDSEKTAAELQADIEKDNTTAPEGSAKRTVARAALFLAEKAFQWRGDLRYDQWERLNHIHTLAKEIAERRRPLAPLLVLRVGERFYVIDGHHRLAAYDTAGWTRGIPVVVFTGSLTEARLLALASNVRDKLPMTTRAKSEAAWQIVKEDLGGLTAQQVADRTGIHLRTVRTMRRAWREINAREGADPEDHIELTWGRALGVWKHGEDAKREDGDFDDGWLVSKAQEVLALMQRTNVAAALMQNFEVTALALQMLSGSLPTALIGEWAGDCSELIEDIAADMARPARPIEF